MSAEKNKEKMEPLQKLLYQGNLATIKSKLSSADIERAKNEYQKLLQDLKTLQKDSRKANMVKRRKTLESKEEKSLSPFEKDENVKALVKLLSIKTPSDEEWFEFIYLTDARCILEQSARDNPQKDSSQDAFVHSTPDGSKTSLSAVQGPELVKNTRGGCQSLTQLMSSSKTLSASHSSNFGQTYAGLPAEMREQTKGTSCETGKSGKQQGGSKTKMSVSQGSESAHETNDMSRTLTDSASSPPPSADSSNLGRTYHVPLKEREEQTNESLSQTWGYGKHQNTPEFTEKSKNRPIHVLLREYPAQKAKQEYDDLLQKYTILLKGQDMKIPGDDSTDIQDITDKQKRKAGALYKHLSCLWEKEKDGKLKSLLRRAFSEFIILTEFQESSKGMISVSAKKDKTSVVKGKTDTHPETPIGKVLNKLAPTSTINIARKQYSLLIKDDDNFKRKFPDKHKEIEVFMEKPEDYPYSPCQQLYDALRQLKKTDPLYEEVWKEYFFLVTSGQQYVIASNLGQLVKTVYKRDIDSMVIPRKSYEDLQNELLEKVKQIDELTSRLSKFASRELTSGNPNIADLSDKHRPTKIGEMYGELYDNEWSEAFEVVKPLEYPDLNEEDSETEYFEKVLKVLSNILMAAFEFSAENADRHLQEIKRTILSTIMFTTKFDQSGDDQKAEYDRFVDGQAMKCRKEAAVYTIKKASEVFKRDRLQHVFKHKADDPHIIAYVDRCVELTWYMRIQDPPMQLHFLQEKEEIPKAQFSFHGRKGRKVLVCVWPALLLFRDGHLVTKGHVLPEEL